MLSQYVLLEIPEEDLLRKVTGETEVTWILNVKSTTAVRVVEKHLEEEVEV